MSVVLFFQLSVLSVCFPVTLSVVRDVLRSQANKSHSDQCACSAPWWYVQSRSITAHIYSSCLWRWPKKLDRIAWVLSDFFTAHKIPMARDTLIHPSWFSEQVMTARVRNSWLEFWYRRRLPVARLTLTCDYWTCSWATGAWSYTTWRHSLFCAWK